MKLIHPKLLQTYEAVKPYIAWYLGRRLGERIIMAMIFSFLVNIVFIDEDNWFRQLSLWSERNSLEGDKRKLMREIEESQLQLNRLQTDLETLEQYAREVYLLKREDEDIFIID